MTGLFAQKVSVPDQISLAAWQTVLPPYPGKTAKDYAAAMDTSCIRVFNREP